MTDKQNVQKDVEDGGSSEFWSETDVGRPSTWLSILKTLESYQMFWG